MNKLIIIPFFFLLLSCNQSKTDNDFLTNFPAESNPYEIGLKLTNRFLSQNHSKGGNQVKDINKISQIFYGDVCTWVGAIRFAETTNDKKLMQRLIERFEPLMSSEKRLLPEKNHVDNNIFGAIPLELYLQTGDMRYKNLGMEYADSQWELPENWKLDENIKRKGLLYGDFGDRHIFQKEQKEWADKGYSWQTRFWVDDMYMITTLQSLAYKATKKVEYINRAAQEMTLYLDSIQEPSGLFHHGPGAPFCWGRGNGWMAVGMADLLKELPLDNPDREYIMEKYVKMMYKLKDLQNSNGMWRQIIDDPSMWEETSGSAMFVYAIITGIKQGWLPANEFGPVARKGWIALSHFITSDGDVKAVCEGTNLGTTSEHYRNRRRITGNLHGQAPYLWCTYALISKQ